MIRAVDYQKLDMTNEEFDYYQALVQNLTITEKVEGSSFFRDLFLSDERGIITIIKPTRPIPWEVMFFLQNLTINQHLRELDARINLIEQKLISQTNKDIVLD